MDNKKEQDAFSVLDDIAKILDMDDSAKAGFAMFILLGGEDSVNAIKNLVNATYNKAIDDFDKAIKEFVNTHGTIPNNFNSDFIAEQLKAGGKNESICH